MRIVPCLREEGDEREIEYATLYIEEREWQRGRESEIDVLKMKSER